MAFRTCVVSILCFLWCGSSQAVNLRYPRGHKIEEQNDTANTTTRILQPSSPASLQSIVVQRQLNLIPLEVIGTEGNVPGPFLPLAKCQGDCDRNSDCVGHLLCFQRGGATTIPGCSGLAPLDGIDYCWDPNDKPPEGEVVRIGNKGNPSVLFPLRRCQGNCESDWDCSEGLVCFHRSRNVRFVPGCRGEPPEDDGSNYCVAPRDLPESLRHADTPPLSTTQIELSMKEIGPNPSAILKQCESDCDRDSDCEAGLVCFQRDEQEEVPGCSGTPQRFYDYCVNPIDLRRANNKVGTTIESPRRYPSMNLLLSQCEGNCVSDSDCAGKLECVEVKDGPVPGCDVNDGLLSYCAPRRPSNNLLTYAGNDWTVPTNFPLGLCESDCDGDFDCKGELVCHQRTDSEVVPSCAGTPSLGEDYCVHLSDEFARPPESGSFRLKLFWEFGYDWQEIFWELEWCMQCASAECQLDDEIILETCTENSTWFVFENLSQKQTQIRVALTDLCMELDKTDGSRSIRIQPCDASNDRQVFLSGDQLFTDDHFEMQTKRIAGCLTQEHHPRGGEVVYRQECERPRRDNTNFWRKY